MTIKKKILFLFLLPSILIATVAAVICYYYIQNTVKQNIYSQLEMAADELQSKLHAYLEGKRGRTIDFSSDGFIKVRTEKITNGIDVDSSTYQLNRHLLYNKKALDEENILEVFVADLDGKVISSTENSRIGQDISGELYFSRTREGRSFISDLHYFPEIKQNTFEVSVLMTANEGMRPVGIIVNRYRGDALGKVTRSGTIEELGQVERLRGLGETGELYIVNKDKLMITGSRFIEDAILKQVVDTKGVKAAFDNGIGMIGIYHDYRGIPILGVSRYIEEMDWVILAGKDVSEAFVPIMRLRNIIIIIVVTGIMAIVAIAIFLAAMITNPIQKLVEGTRRIAKGDLVYRIKTKTKDEIGELAASFNEMTFQLEESKKELQDYALNLEKKVEDKSKVIKKGRDEWLKTFDAITDIITIHDKDFRIVRANKAFFEKFNDGIVQLSDKKCYEIFHGTDRPWPDCPLARSTKNLQPESEEVDDPNMGGVFLVSTYPLFDEQGEFYGAVHQAKDITIQKNIERTLAEKSKDLEKVNKEIEGFIYIISHDLKEPLFVIGSYMSKLSRLYKDIFDDKGKFYIDRINVSIDDINQKIHEIMAVLKVGRVIYDFKNNDTGVIVNNVAKMLGNKMVENKINILIQDNLPTVLCDERRMQDVLLNLLANAIKFMGNHNQRQVRIGCDKNGNDYYKFYVEDTGIGIREEYQGQIFEIFKRLKDIETEGTGVGLAIVKKIVAQHRGKVWVESPVSNGRGTRFCFTIPTSKAEMELTGI